MTPLTRIASARKIALMVQGVLMDLAGVIYTGQTVLPGAVEAMAKLRERMPVRF